MYCGQRIRASTASGNDAPGSGWIDSGGTGDMPTRTYDVAPAEAIDAHSAVALAAPPTAVGGYKIVRFLGAGGMGAVYEAAVEGSDTRVAIKLLSARLSANPASVERFRQEGRVASSITHPRCVFVLRADTDDGRPYIVMELMVGTTLKDEVDRRGPLSPADAVAYILDVIDGLSEAHRLGVIHRDVKPSNCFLTPDGRVKVGDFGLSKSLGPTGGDKHLTQTGAFLGTILFAPPEQIRGDAVGYDSDVYAVAGTLYYLLTGRAPYQHESMAAALAKAVSEPPESIRAMRPEVPVELERAVFCGLERDRDRRWTTLTDFGDALRDLLPANQKPARPRLLALSYLIDVVLLQFALVPVELLVNGGVSVHPFAVNWPAWLVAFVYFAPAEGIFGTTFGKRLLGLRVARVGETGPPGILRAGLRTAAFHALLFGMLAGIGGAIGTIPTVAKVIGLSTPLEQRTLWVALAVLGAAGLMLQTVRSAHGFRGVHDLLTGCLVAQRPLPTRRTRLQSRYPDPLSRTHPSSEPLPHSVGGFAVDGKLCPLPDGGEIWIAEDGSLGRRLLIRVFPAGHAIPGLPSSAGLRPTRLRVVGQGVVEWAGDERSWIGYVAPAGAPLADVSVPGRPLGWADARSVLEQVLDEFEASDLDGSGVWRPVPDQVWVEPTGRVQILDFPLPTGAAVAAGFPKPTEEPGSPDPIRFVRQVATLALEGKPREDGGPVRAPIPPIASEIGARLFRNGPEGFHSLSGLRQRLAETHAFPAEVTPSIRVAHLGVQALLLAWGLIAMFAIAGLNTFGVAAFAAGEVVRAKHHKVAADEPTVREITLATAAQQYSPNDPVYRQLTTALSAGQLPVTLERLEARIAYLEDNLERHRQTLTAPERAVLDLFANVLEPEDPNPSSDGFVVNFLVSVQGGKDPSSVPEPLEREYRWVVFAVSAAAVLLVPLGWAAIAFLLRGGFAMMLAGIAIVRTDGRLAGRTRCAVRELAVWAPLAFALMLTLWVQAAAPGQVLLRTGLWLTAVALLPLYLVIALRNPARGPQDRLAGTYLVPA